MRLGRPGINAIPVVASGLAVVVAGLVLAGWALDIDVLKQIVPGFVSMNPTTAVAVMLAGFSLALQRSPETSLARPQWKRVARLAAAAVVAIGVLRLASSGLGWGTGVDQWLFAARLGNDNPMFPSRMAPNTAVTVVLLGLGLLMIEVTSRNGRRPTEWLASAALLISLLALTGYVYRVPEFSGVARFIPMALHTSVVCVALAIGILVARPRAGMMAVVTGPSPGGMMARRQFPGMIVALLLMGLLRLEGERRGLYGTGLGVALFTVTNIIVFGVLIGWSAKSLHLADAERLRLSAQQRESDAQVRLLLDSTAEAIYGIDAEGRCTFINAACVRMLGYAGSDELLGRDMHGLIHHSHSDGTPYPVADCPIYRAIRGDVPAHVDDERFWRADGSSFAVEYWSYPMRRDGKSFGAVVTFLDITERKRAEERLRHSEERTRAIIEGASDAFIAIDADGVVIGWNQQASAMFGWSRDEVVGLRLADRMLPAQHLAEYEQRLRRFAAGAEDPALNKRIETTALRRGGEEFPVELAIWPVCADGIRTLNAFVHDISERKKADEIQSRFAAIIASSDDAIVSKTLEGIITSWNPGAEQMFGYAAQEAIGQPMTMLIPPERMAEEPQILARIAAGESVDHFETVRVTKDGTRIDVAATISPIRDGSGTIIGASKIARDITERKQAADNILALNAELSANALHLQQTNLELEAFSYTISHDLRAPLRHIDGYARMLHEDAGEQLAPDLRRYLDMISASARQMGTLIDDLLAFSRLGRKAVERTRVDMGALVSRVVDELGAGGDGDRRVSVGPLPAADADPVLLKQVWVNLLSNALKYSAPRGDDARIEISGEHDEGVVRFRIRDNGAGFDMRYADKLFGVFQRLHSQEEFEGTGVGLAIVHRVVVRHGGTIGAHSEPGHGATFTFELPRRGHDAPGGTPAPHLVATETPA